ncbi:MAG TPA: holo-ACP synthase [Syntrophobacteraceae bacterium]|nr:holo-ACP synthase [Syntrophobacteraceae bacterium]
MAVYGVGIDLIRVERLSKASAHWGERFARRVFTSGELAACAGKKRLNHCLAIRFAAKEAFVKALGTGMRSPVLWTDIEVRNNELGKPEISLSPRALKFCSDLGIRSWHLSLTDDGDYGAAVVVLET